MFDRIGTFDEELVRNQDDEFNLRLTQAGGRIWLDPSICTTYWSRATVRGAFRQYFQYGAYKVRVAQKRRTAALRAAAWCPPLLVGGLAAGVGGRPRPSRRPRWPLPRWSPTPPGRWPPPRSRPAATRRRRCWLRRRSPRCTSGYGAGVWWGLWRWRRQFRLRDLGPR